ncbi:glycosyltransferase WbuB, partial [Nitrospirales bacterium NOB]|nr:glycosyltransferase WbuB [Nitrospirales bacterium NOB]
MVTFSPYPADPRPRRAIQALLDEGMAVDLLCLADEKSAAREEKGLLRVRRIPIEHKRGGALAYAYSYSAFILICGAILAFRSIRKRYDLAYIHNMPDVLVFSALVPRV